MGKNQGQIYSQRARLNDLKLMNQKLNQNITEMNAKITEINRIDELNSSLLFSLKNSLNDIGQAFGSYEKVYESAVNELSMNVFTYSLIQMPSIFDAARTTYKNELSNLQSIFSENEGEY